MVFIVAPQNNSIRKTFTVSTLHNAFGDDIDEDKIMAKQLLLSTLNLQQ